MGRTSETVRDAFFGIVAVIATVAASAAVFSVVHPASRSAFVALAHLATGGTTSHVVVGVASFALFWLLPLLLVLGVLLLLERRANDEGLRRLALLPLVMLMLGVIVHGEDTVTVLPPAASEVYVILERWTLGVAMAALVAGLIYRVVRRFLPSLHAARPRQS